MVVVNSHAHYQELCASAAAGQLSAHERSALDEHVKTCSDCRQFLDDFEQMFVALSRLSNIHNHGPATEVRTSRFIARARTEGIPLTRETATTEPGRHVHRWWATRNLAAWATAALFIGFCLVSVMYLRRHFEVQQQAKSIKLSQPSVENSATDKLAHELQSQVRNLEEKANHLDRQIGDQQKALRAAQLEKAELSSRLSMLQTENAQYRNDASQTDAEIQQLRHDLEHARAAEIETKSAYDQRVAELLQLRDQISKLNTQLDRERRLEQALEEVRDLIEDRSVHVITLGSVNEQGRPERAFGRAFYIPGQKLVLFAYDLSDSQVLAAHTFYVWGDKPGTKEPVHSLGKLMLEDQKENRWAIRIEDPDLFARINEVFITLESSKGNVEKPTGRPVLTASLTKAFRD